MQRLSWPGDACYIQERHNDLLSRVRSINVSAATETKDFDGWPHGNGAFVMSGGSYVIIRSS
jgi:hypothetical protein